MNAIQKYFKYRQSLIDQYAKGDMTKREYLQKNYEAVVYGDIGPFRNMDTVEKALFNYQYYNALAKESLDAARRKLMDILCNYQGYQKCVLILVFDAYRVPGSPGAIEQDADCVLFLYRDSYYASQNPDGAEVDADTAECIVAKNRHGETSTVPLGWDGAHTRFMDVDFKR